jgi:hypothetical protein
VVLPEVTVSIDVVSLGVADLVEAVHVELTDEGRVVFVFVVDGEHFFCELRDVVDVQGIARGGPAEGAVDV